MKRKTPVLILASVVAASGCSTMSQQNSLFSKENIGTVLGSGVGILVGSQVGGGNGRRLAMIAGAIAGGMLGKQIGANLDERDRQALALETQKALLTAKDGEAQHWKSNHSDASATITPVSTQTRKQSAGLKRTAKVVNVDQLTLVNATYEAIKGVNIRRGPATSYDRIGSLAAGTSFTALGRTDNDWIAVGRKGVAVGYIYSPLTRPVTAVIDDSATDLDAMVVSSENAEQSGFDLDSMEIVTDQITASTECRTVQYDVRASETNESKQVELCQAADGAWELI
ncbi:SH3 domain-containing protein [Marinobacterium mangrovicola]|uniref:Glycine zipper 2TM protein n=1 Tax=Marinobacterium mangrovicola TaxID=1476959 RepID=A0A4R1GBQ3_9GAMM|nr:SH3 domain-containing protein [Marinobacterium mangrovicola]TCK04130.1 glycine zipper 2TM protein [Marinobacterium mangrovicola]